MTGPEELEALIDGLVPIAWEYVNNYDGDDVTPPLTQFHRKFAGLVVQECILAITEQSENIHAEGTIEAIVILEKYFAVD